MPSTYTQLPFRYALPLLQFILCAVLFVACRPSAQQISHRANFIAENPPSPFSHFVITSPDVPVARSPLQKLKTQLPWLPTLINLPSMLVQLPEVFFRADRNSWIPHNFGFLDWRNLTWPIFGIFFWWFAGRNLDAFLAARRGMIEPAISTLQTAFTAVFAAFFGFMIFLPLFAPTNDSWLDHPRPLLYSAFALLWTTLFAIGVVARIKQARIRRGSAKTVAAPSHPQPQT